MRGSLLLWFLLPLVPLVLWAAAERWSAPAVLPQRWGTAGWSAAAEAGAAPAFARSLLLGAAVAAIATPAGALAARALAHGLVHRSRLVSALLLAPVALPPFAVVMGLNVLLLRARVPALVGVVAVLVVAALPYTTYVLRVAYAGYDTSYEEEARLLGATPRAVWWRVRLPLLAPALAGAAFLAFLVGWSDYIVTVLIGGGRLVTYPLLIASAASGVGNEAVVAVLSLTSLLPPLALLLLAGASGLRGRGGRGRPSPAAAAAPAREVVVR
ncbi:ABC transporter permease subunit [Kineococcus xinjiangensis]|uniref:ABC transporter permease subunit n=1 Tax=Kineococcus xinjiangensis TaxID=512762 RepID=UPI001B80A161|nr:ABC transporter permease subunit [Kineococcus xinjiangensis]